VSVEDTNVTINDNPRVRITVRVDPPGEAPFTLVKTQTVSRVSIPRAGDTCSVLYDPVDPQFRNTVAFGGAAAAFTPAASVAQAPRAPAPAPAAPAAAQPAADPVARLEQLAGLRDQGLITDAEFADKKRRLLEEI
jgi:hypothetical protein